MPTAGDTATASLAVAPHDSTTAAVLSVTGPDGTVTAPAVESADGGATWTASVTYTEAGVWRLSWTVTGTGATAEHELIAVAPVPGGAAPPGRSYATTTQLADYLGTAPPLDGARLLLRASELLDSDFLMPAWYHVDDEGMPTDPLVIDAFAEAVCAQVEFWNEVGEETDISGPLQGAQIGAVNLQFGAGDNRASPTYYAPKLVRALTNLPHRVFHMRVGLVW